MYIMYIESLNFYLGEIGIELSGSYYEPERPDEVGIGETLELAYSSEVGAMTNSSIQAGNETLNIFLTI